MPSGMPPTENLGNQKCQSGHEQKSGTQDVLVWEKTESPSGFSESKEWWHLECLEMHYGYPEALQVACLGLSVRFSSQTEKKKLALSRGRTGWIQAKGSGLG